MAAPYAGWTWMLPGDLRHDVERRICEVAAWWCRPGPRELAPERALRSPKLLPPRLAEVREPWAQVQLLRNCIEFAAVERARLIAAQSIALPDLRSALRSGRLLGHDLEQCTADQLPNAASPFFDVYDNPGWDSWVHCLNASWNRYDFWVCLSWIPNVLLIEADQAMTSSTDCLVWIHPESLGLLSNDNG